VTASESAALRRLLRDNPDSVTHLLETLSGEPLVADVVRQYPMGASAGASGAAGNELGVSGGGAIIQRVAVLRGAITATPYVYAESAFVRERLPAPLWTRLERTGDPIGRVLAAHGVPLQRDDLPPPPEPWRLGRDSGVPDTPVVWARAYRLMVDDLPAFAIREWFFRSVLEARDLRARG
jgi:chorismate-pyruvate lyase